MLGMESDNRAVGKQESYDNICMMEMEFLTVDSDHEATYILRVT